MRGTGCDGMMTGVGEGRGRALRGGVAFVSVSKGMRTGMGGGQDKKVINKTKLAFG